MVEYLLSAYQLHQILNILASCIYPIPAFGIFFLTSHDIQTLFQIRLYNLSSEVLELLLYELYTAKKYMKEEGNASHCEQEWNMIILIKGIRHDLWT